MNEIELLEELSRLQEDTRHLKEENRVLREELRQLNTGERVTLPKSLEHAKFMIVVGEFYLKTFDSKESN